MAVTIKIPLSVFTPPHPSPGDPLSGRIASPQAGTPQTGFSMNSPNSLEIGVSVDPHHPYFSSHELHATDGPPLATASLGLMPLVPLMIMGILNFLGKSDGLNKELKDLKKLRKERIDLGIDADDLDQRIRDLEAQALTQKGSSPLHKQLAELRELRREREDLGIDTDSIDRKIADFQAQLGTEPVAPPEPEPVFPLTVPKVQRKGPETIEVTLEPGKPVPIFGGACEIGLSRGGNVTIRKIDLSAGSPPLVISIDKLLGLKTDRWRLSSSQPINIIPRRDTITFGETSYSIRFKKGTVRLIPTEKKLPPDSRIERLGEITQIPIDKGRTIYIQGGLTVEFGKSSEGKFLVRKPDLSKTGVSLIRAGFWPGQIFRHEIPSHGWVELMLNEILIEEGRAHKFYLDEKGMPCFREIDFNLPTKPGRPLPIVPANLTGLKRPLGPLTEAACVWFQELGLRPEHVLDRVKKSGIDKGITFIGPEELRKIFTIPLPLTPAKSKTLYLGRDGEGEAIAIADDETDEYHAEVGRMPDGRFVIRSTDSLEASERPTMIRTEADGDQAYLLSAKGFAELKVGDRIVMGSLIYRFIMEGGKPKFELAGGMNASEPRPEAELLLITPASGFSRPLGIFTESGEDLMQDRGLNERFVIFETRSQGRIRPFQLIGEEEIEQTLRNLDLDLPISLQMPGSLYLGKNPGPDGLKTPQAALDVADQQAILSVSTDGRSLIGHNRGARGVTGLVRNGVTYKVPDFGSVDFKPGDTVILGGLWRRTSETGDQTLLADATYRVHDGRLEFLGTTEISAPDQWSDFDIKEIIYTARNGFTASFSDKAIQLLKEENLDPTQVMEDLSAMPQMVGHTTIDRTDINELRRMMARASLASLGKGEFGKLPGFAQDQEADIALRTWYRLPKNLRDYFWRKDDRARQGEPRGASLPQTFLKGYYEARLKGGTDKKYPLDQLDHHPREIIDEMGELIMSMRFVSLPISSKNPGRIYIGREPGPDGKKIFPWSGPVERKQAELMATEDGRFWIRNIDTNKNGQPTILVRNGEGHLLPADGWFEVRPGEPVAFGAVSERPKYDQDHIQKMLHDNFPGYDPSTARPEDIVTAQGLVANWSNTKIRATDAAFCLAQEGDEVWMESVGPLALPSKIHQPQGVLPAVRGDWVRHFAESAEVFMESEGMTDDFVRGAFDSPPTRLITAADILRLRIDKLVASYLEDEISEKPELRDPASPQTKRLEERLRRKFETASKIYGLLPKEVRERFWEIDTGDSDVLRGPEMPNVFARIASAIIPPRANFDPKFVLELVRQLKAASHFRAKGIDQIMGEDLDFVRSFEDLSRAFPPEEGVPVWYDFGDIFVLRKGQFDRDTTYDFATGRIVVEKDDRTIDPDVIIETWERLPQECRNSFLDQERLIHGRGVYLPGVYLRRIAEIEIPKGDPLSHNELIEHFLVALTEERITQVSLNRTATDQPDEEPDYDKEVKKLAALSSTPHPADLPFRFDKDVDALIRRDTLNARIVEEQVRDTSDDPEIDKRPITAIDIMRCRRHKFHSFLAAFDQDKKIPSLQSPHIAKMMTDLAELDGPARVWDRLSEETRDYFWDDLHHKDMIGRRGAELPENFLKAYLSERIHHHVLNPFGIGDVSSRLEGFHEEMAHRMESVARWEDFENRHSLANLGEELLLALPLFADEKGELRLAIETVGLVINKAGLRPPLTYDRVMKVLEEIRGRCEELRRAGPTAPLGAEYLKVYTTFLNLQETILRKPPTSPELIDLRKRLAAVRQQLGSISASIKMSR